MIKFQHKLKLILLDKNLLNTGKYYFQNSIFKYIKN